MLFIYTLFTLLISVSSFNTNKVKPVTKFKYVGDTPPLGYFDPFDFVENKSENFLKYLREAELQHSRVAMTSIVTLSLLDYNLDDTLAINYLKELPSYYQLFFLLGFGYIESQRVIKNYQNPFLNESSFTLKDDAEPGKYFDNELDERLMNVELNNGRLAMIGCLGFIVQEFVTQQPIF